MVAYTPEEREGIIESGRRLGVILEKLERMVAPGVSTQALEDEALRLILEGGDEPAFKGYTPEGARRPFPAALCVSVNEEVVHGIPNEDARILKEGDIVSLDFGIVHKGFITDSAVTVPVGKVSKEAQNLIAATERALEAGISAARVGGRIGDISHAIGESFKGTGVSIVKVLGGHAVGKRVHEEPYIANYGYPGTGEEIKEGMVLALEPIANAGKGTIILAPDGYTYRSKDGSISSHSEHTILIEESGVTVVTRRPTERF
ncbi:MAG TPA: type I methionyl aminopeptidase [Candidatus Paceibacterota bacterium]|jgi:methionyl aminopeptidase|nr:type I methionyl aminopeptidase [Candidatus Paceibacterota bacterium]